MPHRRERLPAVSFVAALLACALLPGCRGCDPYEQIRRDRLRFSRISLGRPLGSPCSEQDSASVTRAERHPLGPTGSWGTTAEVDYARTLARGLPPGSNAVFVQRTVFAGYVRFESEGQLRARLYDDVYGAVYGGWSPSRLDVRATEKPVFVALGRGSFGDGGLDQVREICWFPKGATVGTVVYSSAHSPRAPGLRAREVFRKADLGTRGAYYDSRVAAQVLSELAQDRDVAAARAFLAEARSMLASVPDLIDGSTGKRIPSRIGWGREWVDLSSFGLGLSVGTPSFDAEAKDLDSLLAAPSLREHCFHCARHEKLLPIYRFVDARARGQDAPLPDPTLLSRGVVGYDPQAIARLLAGGPPEKLHESTLRFWNGIQALHAGQSERSRAELSAWLAQPLPPTTSGFELAAAAVLLERLQ